MARRTADIKIAQTGRDQGKTFRLTEMPAVQAERWATRAILALSRSGVAIPDDVADAGWASLAVMGLKMLGGVNYADAEPLMAEMMQCVQIVEPKLVRACTDDDYEEVATIAFLRAEVLALHMGFPLGAVISKLSALAPAPESNSPDIEMSLQASESSSQPS